MLRTNSLHSTTCPYHNATNMRRYATPSTTSTVSPLASHEMAKKTPVIAGLALLRSSSKSFKPRPLTPAAGPPLRRRLWTPLCSEPSEATVWILSPQPCVVSLTVRPLSPATRARAAAEAWAGRGLQGSFADVGCDPRHSTRVSMFWPSQVLVRRFLTSAHRDRDFRTTA